MKCTLFVYYIAFTKSKWCRHSFLRTQMLFSSMLLNKIHDRNDDCLTMTLCVRVFP